MTDQPRHADGKFARLQHSEQNTLSPPGRWEHLTEPVRGITSTIRGVDLSPGSASASARGSCPLVRWYGLKQGYDLPEEDRSRLSADPGVRWVNGILRGGQLDPYPA